MKSLTLAMTIGLVGLPPVSVQGQTLAERMTAVYVQSVKYPGSFDRYVAQNRGHFDAAFLQHLNRVAARLLQVANEEIELCNRHVNPEWRSQCMQENQSASLYFWCVSLNAVIRGEAGWLETWTGSAVKFGKDWYTQMGGAELSGYSYEQLIDIVTPHVYQLMVYYFQ